MDQARGADADRLLTTLAMVRVNHERDGSYLKNYLPFAYHCLLTDDADTPVSAQQLRDSLSREFGLTLPVGVVRNLLREARREGKVREDHGIYFPVPAQLETCGLDQQREEFGRDLNYLLDSIAEFAERQFQLSWDRGQAKQTLLDYVDRFSSDLLAAAIEGRPLPAASPNDFSPEGYVLHRFLAEANEARNPAFDFAVSVVKGRMLSDSLYLDIETDQAPGLEGLCVFLDAPLLLYALGYAGEELRTPYTELLEMVEAGGASAKCFTHSLAEAQQILDAAAARVDTGITGEQYFGDVVSFLVRSGRSKTDLVLLSEHLERDIRAVGIEVVETPPHMVEFAPDEERLETMLKARINYTNPVALRRDVDSLTAVHRLRRGRVARHLGNSVAVLVTHNYGVFQVSARFFDRGRDGRTVPQCLFDSSFITLVWLSQPKAFPELPREIVIADAAAALSPPDGLWAKYNAMVQRLREAGEIDESDLVFLRYSDDATRLLMDLTLGREEAVTDGTIKQLLALYRERTVRGVRDELAAERTSHEATQHMVSVVEQRIDRVSRGVGSWSANALLMVIAAVVIAGIALGPIGPLNWLPGWVQVTCVVVAAVAGAWTLFLGGSLIGLRNAVATKLRNGTRHALRRVFGLADEHAG